jgi:nucleoside-diphosphate kinase
LAIERTCVLFKPDAVQRGLSGEILARFERAGLKLVGLKLVRPTVEQGVRFYPNDEGWLRNLGKKSIANFTQFNLDLKKIMGSTDELEIGQRVKRWLAEFLASGPIVCLALEGNHAVENARRLVGPTIPINAPPGTIRGDFSGDSTDHANAQGRVIRNLVHASGDQKEAEQELKFWFKPAELLDYERAGEAQLGFRK